MEYSVVLKYPDEPTWVNCGNRQQVDISVIFWCMQGRRQGGPGGASPKLEHANLTCMYTIFIKLLRTFRSSGWSGKWGSLIFAQPYLLDYNSHNYRIEQTKAIKIRDDKNKKSIILITWIIQKWVPKTQCDNLNKLLHHNTRLWCHFGATASTGMVQWNCALDWS